MVTVLDLIKASFRLAGAGFDPTDAEQADALDALNLLLDTWSTLRYVTPVETLESLTLAAGAGERTIGSGGQLDTVRPIEVVQAVLRDGAGLDWPLEPIAFAQYQELSLKTVSGRPTQLAYRATSPLGRLYFDRGPDQSYTLLLESLKPIAAYATVADALNLLPGYARALKFNLVLELAAEWGVNLRADVVVHAKRSLDVLRRARAVAAVRPVAVATELSSGEWPMVGGEYL